jgi:DNA-binding PadR family transcriptional regulator
MSPMVKKPLTIEHALLGLLGHEPSHGYDLYRRLSDPAGLGLVWHLKQSRLYAMLARLEEAGYVQAAIEPQETRPARKVYSLTPAGRDAYQRWRQAPVARGRQLRLEFLAKLYCARGESEAAAGELIRRQQDVCREWRRQQQALAERAEHRTYDRLVHLFRVGQLDAMLHWLTQCATTELPAHAVEEG